MFKNDSLSFKYRNVKSFYDCFLRIFKKYFIEKKTQFSKIKYQQKQLTQIFLENIMFNKFFRLQFKF